MQTGGHLRAVAEHPRAEREAVRLSERVVVVEVDDLSSEVMHPVPSGSLAGGYVVDEASDGPVVDAVVDGGVGPEQGREELSVLAIDGPCVAVQQIADRGLVEQTLDIRVARHVSLSPSAPQGGSAHG